MAIHVQRRAFIGALGSATVGRADEVIE